jgi:hypothetical protein
VNIVLGKLTWPIVAGKDQDKFDEKDREALMLIKLSVIDEMLTEVQTGKSSSAIWTYLKDLCETSDRGRTFYLKNMLCSIMMDEHSSLWEHFLKIKDI